MQPIFVQQKFSTAAPRKFKHSFAKLPPVSYSSSNRQPLM